MLVALGAGMLMSSCSKDDGISADEVKTIVQENSLSAEQIKELVEKNLLTNDQIEGFIKTHSLTKDQIITLIQSNSLTEDQLKESLQDLCSCSSTDVITDEELKQILVDFHKYVADTEYHTVAIDDLKEYIYNWHGGPVCKIKVTGLEKYFTTMDYPLDEGQTISGTLPKNLKTYIFNAHGEFDHVARNNNNNIDFYLDFQDLDVDFLNFNVPEKDYNNVYSIIWPKKAAYAKFSENDNIKEVILEQGSATKTVYIKVNSTTTRNVNTFNNCKKLSHLIVNGQSTFGTIFPVERIDIYGDNIQAFAQGKADAYYYKDVYYNGTKLKGTPPVY